MKLFLHTLIKSILFFLISGCLSESGKVIEFPDSAKLKIIHAGNWEPKNSCEDYGIEVSIPSTLSRYFQLRDAEELAYCIEINIENPKIFEEKNSPGLSLGYIDNYPQIFLNGNTIHNSDLNNNFEYYNYEKLRYYKISPNILLKKNIIEIKFKPSIIRENGMGIYAGRLYIDLYENIDTKSNIYKFYSISKVVLFFGTSLLFFTLYLGRKREKSYLFFSLFLFTSSIYFFSKLEMRYEIGINLYILKKIEYMSLALIIPMLNFFLPSILNLTTKSFLSIYNFVVIIIFIFIFSINDNVKSLDEINHIYHIPIILFSLFLSILLVLTEIKKKNKRSVAIFFILFIPFILSLIHILNSSFLFIPEIMNFSLGGDSILILVICMTIYVAIGFYRLQKNLDSTIQKEEFLRKTFQLYVPPKDLASILKGYDEGIQMSEIAENKKMIILFCDIREFTGISEKMSPEEIVSFLNEYFTFFNSIIIEKGGVIDKLIGDCIMARFDSEDEVAALETALLLKAHLKRYNSERKKRRQKIIQHGIGLSMGSVVIGNIGSMNKMDYTVIGDAVNLASRLESLTKYYGIDILVSENLYRSTKKEFYFREIDKIRVKGKRKITRIYQPLGIIK